VSEISKFVRNYSEADAHRIVFAWNGRHADEFEDANLEFRQRVLDAVEAEPAAAPLTLIRDLFRAETELSREAWCVDQRVALLARVMLIRDGKGLLLEFLRGKCQSFDASMCCGRAYLEPHVASDLLQEVERRLTTTTDEQEIALLRVGVEMFTERAIEGPT